MNEEIFYGNVDDCERGIRILGEWTAIKPSQLDVEIIVYETDKEGNFIKEESGNAKKKIITGAISSIKVLRR